MQHTGTKPNGTYDKKYGGVWTDLAILPVGTKFHVCNGAWDGVIIEEDGKKAARANMPHRPKNPIFLDPEGSERNLLVLANIELPKNKTKEKNTQDQELEYIIQFAQERCETDERWDDLEQEQLRALWTAYCLHKDLDCDTRDYDEALGRLWFIIANAGIVDYVHEFDKFMGKFLS